MVEYTMQQVVNLKQNMTASTILAIYDNSDTGICEFSETAELARIHGDELHITEFEFEFGNYIVLYTGRKPTTATKSARSLATKSNTPMHSKQVVEVLTDPSTSDWLKRAINQLLERDPADALNDVEILQEILEDRLNETFNKY